MTKEMFQEVKPVFDFIYELIAETEQKETELAEVRFTALKLYEQVSSLQQEVSELKRDNCAMKAFIENEVPEEKQKLIFK